MEHFGAAWNIIKENLVGWVLFFFVFMVVASFTFGLGFLLVPNVLRCVRDAIDSNTAPEIGGIFNFDNIADDAVGMIIHTAANVVGSFIAGVGALITGVLFFWIPMLLADNQVPGAESWKASLAHSKGNFVDILVFSLIGGVIVMIGAIPCGLGLLVAVPVVVTAGWLFYTEQRAQILELAQQDGVNLLNG